MISADKRHIPGAGHKNTGLNTAAIYCSSWIRGSSCRGSVIQTLYAQGLSPFLHCEALYLVMEPGWRKSIVIFASFCGKTLLEPSSFCRSFHAISFLLLSTIPVRSNDFFRQHKSIQSNPRYFPFWGELSIQRVCPFQGFG